MDNSPGKWMIIVSSVIVLAGIIVYFFHDRLTWLGRLPGDIRIENENVKFYFPIVTCIIISIIGSVILYIIRKFF